MKKLLRKRIASGFMAAVLLASNLPVLAAAEEVPQDTSLCEHHAAHTSECGYVEGKVGADCTHQHDDSCYGWECAHIHGECGYAAAVEGSACTHQHDDLCGYQEATEAMEGKPCTHAHNEQCNYVEAKDEIPCSHVCSEESGCTKVLDCKHTHDDSCGYVEAIEAKPCTFDCPDCAQVVADAAAISAVQSLIDTLPTVEEVTAMELEAQVEAYNQVQAAYTAYEQLTDAQKTTMEDPATVFEPLFTYFNSMAATLEEIASGTPDGTRPILNGLTISANEVKALDKIEVIVNASDDISGVKQVTVTFSCEELTESLTCNLSNTYWNSESNENVPYEDGCWHGTIEVDQYQETGVFVLDEIYLVDAAGNTIFYRGDDYIYPPNFVEIPTSLKGLSFTVVESLPDSTRPVLNNMTISSTSITAPGTVDVIVNATDDLSGIETVTVEFSCEELSESLICNLSNTYRDAASNENVPYEDGCWHGTIEVDQYQETGNFVLYEVYLVDAAGNTIFYRGDDYIYPPNFVEIPTSLKDLSFTVVESLPDSTRPVLNNMTISSTSITAPGTVDVIVNATDDLSGIETVTVEFSCEELSESLICNLSNTYRDAASNENVPYEDGCWHGTIEVDQYQETGNFVLYEVYLIDVAGNTIFYRGDDYIYPPNFVEIPDALKNLEISVTNTDADITTSTSKDTFVEEVTNAANDAHISADFSSNGNLSDDVFTAIAGTDKTLDLTSEGITWQFKGSDVSADAAKDIDLNVEIMEVEEDTSTDGEAIEDLLDGSKGVVMKFADNGTLPGKATIQIKVDYAMRQYLGSDTGLCVYYYNNQTGKLELIASNLSVINDTYVEFEITHCSDYVLTAALGTSSTVASGTCGNNLTWTLDSHGTLTISGTGAMYDFTTSGGEYTSVGDTP